MSKMPSFSAVLYVATRLHLDGEEVAPQLLSFFIKAGVQLPAQELLTRSD